MTPAAFLAVAIAVTAAAAAVARLRRRERRRLIRNLAAEWRMNYSAADQLRVAAKVAPVFPVVGAADLHVLDVLYATEKDRHRYVFTVEFTTGLLRRRRRLARVASFVEPRDRTRPAGPVLLAPETGTVIEQYRHLAPAGAVVDAREVTMPPDARRATADRDTPAARP